MEDENLISKSVRAHMDHMENMKDAPLFAAKRDAPGAKKIVSDYP